MWYDSDVKRLKMCLTCLEFWYVRIAVVRLCTPTEEKQLVHRTKKNETYRNEEKGLK